MGPMNSHRLRGNCKAMSAALGVGVFVTMGALTLAHPTSAVGTPSDSWTADADITLIPATRALPSFPRRSSPTHAPGPHRTLAPTTSAR